jgi:hypothetical protein
MKSAQKKIQKDYQKAEENFIVFPDQSVLNSFQNMATNLTEPAKLLLLVSHSDSHTSTK